MKEPSIQAIVQRQQFEEKCADYYQALLRYAVRLTNDRTEAEELTQSAFLRFWKHMERTNWEEKVTHPKAYLGMILRRLRSDWLTDLISRRKKEGQVNTDDDRGDEILPQIDTGQSDDSAERIEEGIYNRELIRSLPLKFILSGLTKEELQLLQLRRVDELSPKEIAPILGKNVYQVRYDLNGLEAKIRYRVRLYLKQTGGDSPL